MRRSSHISLLFRSSVLSATCLALCWPTSTRMSSRLAAQETLGALVAGCFVDLDHFVAAGSTQMKVSAGGMMKGACLWWPWCHSGTW